MAISNNTDSTTSYLGQGDIASVCEWRDDKSSLAAEELVLVVEVHVGDADLGLLLLLLEVEPRLLQPLELVDALDVHPAQLVEDVPLVHVHRDQRLELRPLHLRQVLHCLADQGVQDVQELVVRVAHYLIMFS